MKIKKVSVQIKPLNQALNDAAMVMASIKKGTKVSSRKGLSFGDIDSFRQVFTPKRLELIQMIKYKHPQSIYELAKLTKREFKNVVTDIKILEENGLIDTKKVPIKGGYKVTPIFDYDRLDLEIVV